MPSERSCLVCGADPAHLGPRSRAQTCPGKCRAARKALSSRSYRVRNPAAAAASWRKWATKNREHLHARDRQRNATRGWNDPAYVASLLRRRERNRRWIRDYKSVHPCVGTLDGPCPFGPATDPRVLEFDHLRDKAYNVSDMVLCGVSISYLAAEVAKCVVRCANCHKIVTHQRAESATHRLHSEGEALDTVASAER